MRFKIGLLIGRFQPFHNGHLYLIKKSLEISEKIVFGIGSAGIFDKNNPLGYEERKKMLEKVIKKEKIKERVLKIVPLEDFFDDQEWLANVKKQVGEFDLVVGNNDWTNKIMREAEYQVKQFPYYGRSIYEGWRIRKLIKTGKKWQERVPDYIVKLLNGQIVNGKRFNHIVLGGTFDHFHKGHKAFIDKALETGRKITIGLTTEELYKNKFFKQSIQSYKEREKNLKKYLPYDRDIDIVPFSEFTGGADKGKDIEAIIVSRLTYPNALKINKLREKNNLKPLRIVIVNDILADDGRLISSERIRAGEIDRDGRCYKLSAKLREKKKLVMPENLREELRKPLGRVFKSTKELLQCFKTLKWTMVVAVGDIIVDALMKNGIGPEVKIIDFKTRRKQNDLNRYHLVTAAQELYINKPGTINLKTAEKLKELIHQQLGHPKGVQPQSWLVIDGEEDLLALPAILFSPLGSLVFYGHWQLGVIGVEVTEEMKEKASQIVKKFR